MAESPAGDTIPVLMNAAAGRHRRHDSRWLQRALDAAGVAAAVRSSPPSALERAVEAARGAPIVAVAGGDGTMRAAAAALAGTDSALAVLPTGTLNNFARRLGVHDLEHAAAALRNGHVERLTIGRAGDVVFLNTATFGLYADVVRRRDRWRGRVGKWPAALLAFLVAIARDRLVDVALTIDGRQQSYRTALVWVGVGYGSFPVVAEATEQRASPELEVAILRPRSRSGLFGLGARMAWGLMRGRRPIRDEALEVLHTSAFTLDSPRGSIDLTVDGEPMRATAPLEITLEHGVLRVITDAARPGRPADLLRPQPFTGLDRRGGGTSAASDSTP